MQAPVDEGILKQAGVVDLQVEVVISGDPPEALGQLWGQQGTQRRVQIEVAEVHDSVGLIVLLESPLDVIERAVGIATEPDGGRGLGGVHW